MSPFSDDPTETIAALGEKQLLKHLREWLGAVVPPSPEGMGDDCAVLPGNIAPTTLVTTDSVVLGHHFLEGDEPEAVGAKLLKRSLSDIAAMGGYPDRAVVAGLLPRTLRLDWLERFARGLSATAGQYHTLIAGGDLSESPATLAFNLTLLGSGSQLMYRTGAREGDLLWVTGPLGGSRLGRHLLFEPRLTEGQHLAEQGMVRSCIDISDGLAIDLGELLLPRESAAIEPDRVPIHPDAEKAATESGNTALWHALNDGEDHELLFITRPMDADKQAAFINGFDEDQVRPVCIGKVVTRQDAAVVDATTSKAFESPSGHDHFR